MGYGLCNAAQYQEFDTTGRFIQNHDGDTFRIQTADRDILIVRFAGSDTPETAQAYWKAARRELRTLLEKKQIRIACYKKNRERDVCGVFSGDVDVGLEMVRRGYAWYAYQFAHEQTQNEREEYRSAENDAKTMRLGLWADPDPMPPWVCRDLRRHGQKCR